MPLMQTEQLKELARSWLISHQDSSGGWAERPGVKVNVLNTAEVMLSLFASGIDAGHKSIQAAVHYLTTHRLDDSFPAPDRGAWARVVSGDSPAGSIRHIPDILRSSMAITALIKAGRHSEPT